MKLTAGSSLARRSMAKVEVPRRFKMTIHTIAL